jgi:hypothetical protein
MLRATAFAALALLIVGCTPVQWQHASLGTPPSADELGYCNHSAYYEAQRQAFFDDFAWPYYRRYPYGFHPYRNQFFRERDLFDYCMRARGYQLVPVRPADRNS